MGQQVRFFYAYLACMGSQVSFERCAGTLAGGLAGVRVLLRDAEPGLDAACSLALAFCVALKLAAKLFAITFVLGAPTPLCSQAVLVVQSYKPENGAPAARCSG